MKRERKVFVALIVIILAVLAYWIWQNGIEPAVQNPCATETSCNDRCPVSGAPSAAIHTRTVEGKTYSFCSQECAETFSKNPNQYLNN